MQWHTPILVIIAILIGAYVGSKYPQVNVLSKVLP